MEPSRQELLAENEELKRRLEEAEENLKALRTGAVDALVEHSSEGEQVYTFRGAANIFRHLVENMNEGAATLTAAGDILYANGRLAEILGLSLEQVIGSRLREYVHESDRQLFDALFTQARKGESKGEVSLLAGSGLPEPAYLSFSSLTLEDAPGPLSLVVSDLRKQKLEEAVVEDGKLCQEILLRAEQAIAVCDWSGRIIRASRGLHELCGQDPLHLPFQQAFPLRLSSSQPFFLAPLFQGETLQNVEATFQRPDGSQVHVLVNAGPLLAESTEITGFVAALTDISERKQAGAEKKQILEKLKTSEKELQVLNKELQALNEKLQTHMAELQAAHKALRKSQEDLTRAQAVAHLGSWRLDVRQNQLTWSEENYRIFGVAEGTPLNYETFLSIVYPEDREYVDRKWTAALEGEPYIIEHRIVVGDAVKWVQERVELEFDSQGRLLGGFGTTQDITARKHAEAVLKAAHIRAINEKNRLEAVMEALPVGVALLDERGGTVQCNEMFDTIWGGAGPRTQEVSDYLAYKAWWLNTGKQVRPEEWASAQAVQHGKTVIGQLMEIERFDGVHRYVINSGAPIRDADGKITGCAVAIFDITEQRRAEVLLRESEERLRMAAQAGRMFAFEWDPDTDAVKRSPEAGLILGLSGDSAEYDTGQGFFAKILPEDRDIFVKMLQSLNPESDRYSANYRIVRADNGQLLWLEENALALFDAAGKLQRLYGMTMDITARKQAEKLLRESEERYRSLVELSPNAILVIAEGKYVFANPAAAELFGTKTPTDLVGQDVLGLAPYEYREFVERRIKEVLAGDREDRQEAKIMRLDGQSIDVEASAQAIGYQGRPAILLILRDITVQKKALEVLHQAHAELEERVRERTKELQFTVTQLQEEMQERLRAEAELSKQTKLVHDLYNQAPCGYHSLDPEGTFVQINDTELTWLGFTRDEVVSRMKFQDILTKESRKIFQKNFPIFMERGWVRDLEYDLIRKDGSLLPVLLSATAITDEAGNYLMSRSTVYDLTDRIQAEAALAKERQRLFQVLEQLPAYVVLLCPDHTVAYANREFIRRFGVAEENQRCYEFLFGRDNPCEDCLTFKVLEINDCQEWEWQGPDGRTYGVYDYPFTDVDGSPLILELGLDITARKGAEAALRESEEKLRYLTAQLLTAQENERKRIASELHDELGHALMTIKLQLRLLKKHLAPEQFSLGDEIESMAEYLNKVINDDRRLYQALTPGDLEDLGLTTALSSMVDEFVRLYNTIGWSVHLDNIDDLYPPPAQTVIYRIIQEILTNIGKHANASQVAVIIKREPQGATFMVEDDGQGFDMEKVLGAPAVKKGLGLAAMEERVRILGGSLTIWSQENHGTRITFTIPVSQGGN